ncbi:hypothetical protein F5Y01DRAFT_312891 [Xylaria sp. FL0043]|nr:hypothetical protein F5Y01DRAFT_312891 [Xylaria sp. FL0043]
MSSGQTLKTISEVQTRPTTFLSLAPETSASYPTAQDIKPAAHPRRSSSVSSASSIGSLRVLKLGPVHYGEHPDEHKEDFHEHAIVQFISSSHFLNVYEEIKLIHARNSLHLAISYEQKCIYKKTAETGDRGTLRVL